MPTNGNGDKAERLASNAWFTNIGRAAAIAALPLLGYMGKMIIDVQSDVRVLNATISLNMSDRYRAADATRDFKLRDLELDSVKLRLIEVERLVRK